MKKFVFLLSIIFTCCFMLPDYVKAAPKTPQPVLQKAVIDVVEDVNKVAKVKEHIVVTNTDLIKNRKFEFTLSRINDLDVENLVIKINGEILKPDINKGKALVKLSVPFKNDVKEANIEAEYTVALKKDCFEVPMLVPIYASMGAESIVTLNITVPEGMYIYSNSFPVVPHMEEGNHETIPMANIPSHIKFEFGAEKEGFFNEFSVISYVVFFALVAVIAKWIYTEINSGKN